MAQLLHLDTGNIVYRTQAFSSEFQECFEATSPLLLIVV